jgi:hypothetical protein
MRWLAPVIGCIALILIASMTIAQTSRPSNRTNASRLTQPWSKMTTLTNEQINQIADIHRKSLAEIKAIEAKERSDIVALLTDEQKIELNRVENPSKTAPQQ